MPYLSRWLGKSICLNSPKGMNRLAYGHFVYDLGCRKLEREHTVHPSLMSNFDEKNQSTSPWMINSPP